ncbi:MAG: glycosyltransferase family 9 protein [Deltaproteobacteria bacterium]|nr:glycosyltransferase family 9 protein [Deltaproteobacteria bacterium]MBW2051220.1 glycosyltransferase family 9 protein [Deltaproteobacteria bacterium]MBW2139861.1 glycosyltransferase family 9 protein [Deltaproteobacteria bacterium]MBW2322025.1 glycosyltransferase family 9 protein [Deltaproteobacteria bacterium]
MTGRPGTGKPPEADEKFLVLIRGALGDVLLALPFIAALPAHFKVQALTLVGRRANLELLINQPFVSAIMDHDQAAWAGLYQDPPKISTHLSRLFLSHKGAVVLTKNIADPALSGLKQSGLPMTLAVPSHPPEGGGMHLTDHMFAASGIKPLPEPTLIKPTAEAMNQALSFLEAERLDRASWIALHPGSGGRKKNWPLDQWFELARGLSKKSGLNILFIQGPAESGLGKIIKDEMAPRKVFLAQELTLPVLAALLNLGRCYIGHDSGVTHLSAKLGLPTIAIFGPTDPACWAPRGPRVTILSPPRGPDVSQDWNWLQPQQVIQAALKLLERFP